MEKRYDHITCDAQMRDLWEQTKTYQNTTIGSRPFTIDTPPPTVSGSLHIGHIFSYTQTDIIARYKRMTGHNVLYPFGFDGNGLATERFVEKKHNTNAAKLGREKFIELCLQTTNETKDIFINLWKTIGISANFDKTYSTISKEVQKISQESFIRLVKDGYCYIKEEPALYCTRCRTTVAQAELDDTMHNTTFNDIRFTTSNGHNLTIATTRPELLPSCVALLYHPDDKRYINLKAQKALVPIFGQEVPIIEDELVTMDKGTGLVMVCTFGDKNDIEWFKKHNLPFKQSIDFNGTFNQSCGPLAGLSVIEARKKIIELLKEQNILTNQEQIQHSVNIHERCGNDIEYTILPQWFIDIVKHKEKFLEAANNIAWHPAHMKARFVDWVTNLSWDWCISRQRVYGIPFPVWYCDDCKEILTASIDDLPIDPQNTPYAGPCPQCKGNNIRPEKDVMDTWNTSSITPFIVKQMFNEGHGSPFDNQAFLPMSMRPQAHDIIRTWAFYTIIKSWMHQKQIPWSEIVISGYVLSEQKEKISKSKGNAPTEPEQLLKQFAPDAIRFWTASGTLGQDIAFSPDQIKIGQKLMNKLWNAFKFVHMNLENYQYTFEEPKELGVVNQWIIDQTNNTLTAYHKHFNKHEFGLALQSIEQLFWQDFCDNYVEIIKDQFFNPDNYNKQDIETTKWTLYNTSFRILQMYAPYMPHITEYLYQQLFLHNFKTTSLHLTQFPASIATDKNNQKAMDVILEIIAQVRKLKTEHQLSLRTEIQTLTIQVTDTLQDVMKQQESILKGVTKAQTILFTNKQITTHLISENEIYNIYIDATIIK